MSESLLPFLAATARLREIVGLQSEAGKPRYAGLHKAESLIPSGGVRCSKSCVGCEIEQIIAALETQQSEDATDADLEDAIADFIDAHSDCTHDCFASIRTLFRRHAKQPKDVAQEPDQRVRDSAPGIPTSGGSEDAATAAKEDAPEIFCANCGDSIDHVCYGEQVCVICGLDYLRLGFAVRWCPPTQGEIERIGFECTGCQE